MPWDRYSDYLYHIWYKQTYPEKCKANPNKPSRNPEYIRLYKLNRNPELTEREAFKKLLWNQTHKGVKHIEYLALRNIPTNKVFCELCPDDDKRLGKYRHHPDYNYPLIVVMVCNSCHLCVHRTL